MAKESQPDRMDVWRDFLATYAKVIGAVEQEMQAEDGLPLNWFDVLIQLYEAPDGRLRMQDLAESVMLTRSGLTRRIDRLAAAGLVRREPSPDDRRGMYTALTKEGRRILRRVVPSHVRHVEHHFRRHLSEEDAGALRAGFAKVLDAADGGAAESREDADESA